MRARRLNIRYIIISEFEFLASGLAWNLGFIMRLANFLDVNPCWEVEHDFYFSC